MLFPGARIQLHIFEERYREMIAFCEEHDRPFLVSLIRAGQEVGDGAEPYLVGTSAKIERVHRYPDGRLHISAVGIHRYRIRKLNEDMSYMLGQVEPVYDEESELDSNRMDALRRRTEESFRVLLEGMLSRPDFDISVQLPEDPTMLGFVVANFLDLENMQKQQLLECVDPGERLGMLIPLIEKQIAEARTLHLQRLTPEDMSEWINPN